jgi:hypothetical protein
MTPEGGFHQPAKRDTTRSFEFMKGGENEVGKIRVKEERTLEVSIFRGN